VLHRSYRVVPCLFCVALTSIACGTTGEPPTGRSSEDVAVSPSPSPNPASPNPPGLPSQVEPTPSPTVTPIPATLPRYEIEISAEARAQLEAAPWDAEDVTGSFTDGDHAFSVELNYRGAYALSNLVNSGSTTRNWKVKFPKEDPFHERREWNFNRETHLRHKLAYDLMRAAGVRVPSAEYVLLGVNGEDHGMYLRYEDPDNKAWVTAQFGSNAGDLFKAAFDLPNEPQRFALLTDLGPNDEAYFLHYNKKLNNNDAAATDFGNLKQFISELNGTADDDFAAWLPAHFDVESFTSYLVVANFVSNWDSYPQRPKNYWLYQGPFSGRWFYVPWDMDATFQTRPSPLAPMGPEASIFHSFDRFEPVEPNSDEEGTERPLVRRMFAVPSFRDAYVRRYRELTKELLDEEFLEARLAQLTTLCEAHVSEEDFAELTAQNEDIREYVERRVASVSEQLSDL
jgi:spore coat protein CotH